MVIEWIAINKIKEYSTDDIKQLFTEAHENRKYSHKYVTAINNLLIDMAKKIQLFLIVALLSFDVFKLEILPLD